MQLEVYGDHNSLPANLLEFSTALDLKVVDKRLPREFPILFVIYGEIAEIEKEMLINIFFFLTLLIALLIGNLCSLTAITQLVHHGMIFVPIGYTFGAGMSEMEKVKGGSPYGAGTFAGDGSRQPSELELAQAFHQGKYFAGITKKLKGSA